jgi:class 3 adenylate cyclase
MLELDTNLRTRLSRFLTSDLLDDLPQANALMQSSQRLSSLHKTIASFLPQYIAENEDLHTQDFGNLSPGTFMFADVSGFTALSERIRAQAGAAGIEVLTQIFNDYFATMLEILAKSDGQMLKFAGDALLTFFPTANQRDEFPKAVKTGLRMQRAMREKFQPIQNNDLNKLLGQHNMELTMSIGLSKGNLFEALVGNISQRDHMIMGYLPGQADAAEKAGQRDEVIIPAALLPHYQDLFQTTPLSEEFHQVVDNFGDNLGDYEFSMPQRRRAKSSFLFSMEEDNALIQELEEQLERVEVISRFVSSEIINKLVVSGDHIESENRLATVIFVQFTGFAELLEAWGEDKAQLVAVLLSQYYSLMQRIISTHGGVLTRSDPYSLGCKLLITFGAPVAHPDDADRAVETCLDMLHQLEVFNKRLRDELPSDLASLYPFIKQRMGITQGDVFAGEVGWRQRREYTVMGDDVNLAARLMARADYGQVVIGERVYEQVGSYFEVTPLDPFQAKGKSQPILSYAVQRARKGSIATTSDTPFIGRDVILMSLKMALQQAERGPKKLKAIALTGEIGVGKTRLAKQFSVQARSAGFNVAWATCRTQSNRKTTWASLLMQLSGIDLGSSPEEQKQHFNSVLAELHLTDLEDVLSDLLFDSSESKRAGSRTQKRQAAKSNKALFSLYDKLDGNNDPNAVKSQASEFRQKIQKLGTSSSNLPSWSELAMGTSLTDALIRFLEVYGKTTPILLVIDDVHKENQRALNLLKRIIAESTNARVMMLTTYELSEDPKLEISKIAVSDLPEAQTYLMTSAMLNSSDLGPKLSRFLWDSTNGRPLYIESLVQNLQHDQKLLEANGVLELSSDSAADSVPDSIRGLIISRIDRLEPEARQVLRAAAILDDQITLNNLMFLTDFQDPSQIKTLLEQLVYFQLLEESPEGPYRFKHGVTQQALYEEMTRYQRHKLHERIAQHYQQGDKTNLFRAAFHLQRAGKLRQAADLMVTAAQEAEQAQQLDYAADLYNRALEIFPDDNLVQEKLLQLQQQIS